MKVKPVTQKLHQNVLRVLKAARVAIEVHSKRPDYGMGTHLHVHDYPSLLYIVSGSGTCEVEGNTYDIMADSVIILNPSEPHKIKDRRGRPMLVYALYFTDYSQYLAENVINPLFKIISPIAIPPHISSDIKNSLRQMLHEQNKRSHLYIAAMQQCLTSILIPISRVIFDQPEHGTISQDNSEARVRRVLDYVALNSHLHHSLSNAARSARLSQRQFSNICTALTSTSFVQYLNSIRSKKAEKLLRSTDMPISAIAFEVGFEELSTFYRAFKKHQNQSPSAIRKNQ